MNIYNDTTKGFKEFILRIKQAKTDNLLGNFWGESSGKRADLLQDWFIVAGEKKMYRSTFELINDIIEKLDECTVEELEAVGGKVETKVIHTKHKRFYMAEYLKEVVVESEEILANMDEKDLGEFVEHVEETPPVDPVEIKKAPVKRGRKPRAKKAQD